MLQFFYRTFESIYSQKHTTYIWNDGGIYLRMGGNLYKTMEFKKKCNKFCLQKNSVRFFSSYFVCLKPAVAAAAA